MNASRRFACGITVFPCLRCSAGTGNATSDQVGSIQIVPSDPVGSIQVEPNGPPPASMPPSPANDTRNDTFASSPAPTPSPSKPATNSTTVIGKDGNLTSPLTNKPCICIQVHVQDEAQRGGACAGSGHRQFPPGSGARSASRVCVTRGGGGKRVLGVQKKVP